MNYTGNSYLNLNWHFILFTFFLIAGAGIMFLSCGCSSREIAGGPFEGDNISDGIYHGSSRYGPVRVRVRVTVSEGEVRSIELLRHFRGRGQKAEEPVIERIIREKSTDVDSVTGATGSSIAIMNAVEEAIEKGRKASRPENDNFEHLY